MEYSKSSPGYPRLSECIILTQTDTTVGFLSQDARRLASVKNRAHTRPFLKNIFTFKTLKEQLRIPNSRKKEIRRAKKTTFIVKNQAFRVASLPVNSALLTRLGWCYSTSANRSGEAYDPVFANEKADIIIQNQIGLFETKPSKILKINDKKRVRLR